MTGFSDPYDQGLRDFTKDIEKAAAEEADSQEKTIREQRFVLERINEIMEDDDTYQTATDIYEAVKLELRKVI